MSNCYPIPLSASCCVDMGAYTLFADPCNIDEPEVFFFQSLTRDYGAVVQIHMVIFEIACVLCNVVTLYNPEDIIITFHTIYHLHFGSQI